MPSLLSSTVSYSKKDSEAASAQARLKDLEAQLNSKDALLATAVSEKRGLEVSLADQQEQIQEVFLSTSTSPPLPGSVSVFATLPWRVSVIPVGRGSRTNQKAAHR